MVEPAGWRCGVAGDVSAAEPRLLPGPGAQAARTPASCGPRRCLPPPRVSHGCHRDVPSLAMAALSDSLIEQLCRSRLFELFPEVPGKEVEDCYMRCGGVLRVTYQMLLERMATAPMVAPPPMIFSPSTSSERFRRTSGTEAERLRAEEAARTIQAEAQLATKQLRQHELAIAAAESARETAERAAKVDRAQCEEVAEQLSSIRERVEQLDKDFQRRIQDAAFAEMEREAAAAAAAAAQDADSEATAASLTDRVAELEASIAATGEALESAAARRRALHAEETWAKTEEAELRKTIGEMKLQQERDERDTAAHVKALAHEQQKRDALEEETSELDRQRGRVDGELDQLSIQTASLHGRKVGRSAAEVGGTSTDPNGIEALVGEDEASYIRRQQKLKQEAKERMAAKFGGKGLGRGQRHRKESISSSHSSSSAEAATILTAETAPKQKRRGASQPDGAVDLRRSLDATTVTPSLAEWLAQRDLAAYVPHVAEAMKKAEVTDEEAVPLLDAMADRELKEFIDACDQSQRAEQPQTSGEHGRW